MNLVARLTLLLLASTSVDALAQVRSLSFEDGRIESLLVRDLDRDGRDELIAIGHVVREGETTRRLRIWPGSDRGFEDGEAADTEVPPNWTAIALADWLPTEGVELLALEPGGFRAHPLDPLAPDGRLRFHPQGRTLLSAPTYFERPSKTSLPTWPLVDDEEGTRPAAWVPLKRGYARISWTPGGRAELLESIDLSPFMVTRRVYDDSMFTVQRELPFPTLVDVDGDGGEDLVFENIRGRELHLLRARRREDGSWHHPGQPEPLDDRDQSTRVEDTRVQKTFRRLVDLDRDGRVDLITWRVLGDLGGSMSFQTRVSVLGGVDPEEGGLRFAPRGEMTFDGLASVAAILDVNGDRKRDLVVVRTDPTSFLGSSVSARYAVYLEREDGLFPEQPSFEISHEIPSDSLTEADLRVGRLPPAFDLSTDYDRDGVRDLLLVTAGRQIVIRRGSVERRTHDDRVWDVLRFEEPPWLERELDASFQFVLAHPSKDQRVLAFARDDRILLVPLP